MGNAGTRVLLAAALSGVLHGALLLTLAPNRSTRTDQGVVVSFEFFRGADENGAAKAEPELAQPSEPTPVEPGAHSLRNIDRSTRAGGGARSGATIVTWLVSEESPVRLHSAPQTVWREAQMNRLQTARSHASFDRRRATPNPQDDTFVATGVGNRRQRTASDRRDAQHGAPVGGPSSSGSSEREAAQLYVATRGMLDGDVVASQGRATEHAPASPETENRPARGFRRGRGQHPVAARVATGRAAVDEGPAATQASRRDRRVRDRRNAELRVDRAHESWVDASSAVSQSEGRDSGGVGALGRPGSGARPTQGGHARPRREGPGNAGQLDTDDARYVRWYLQVRRKIFRRLTFPQARALAMDQGVSVVQFVVSRDGGLEGQPRLERTSGFEDFDDAATLAIMQAAPFPPIPPELIDGATDHHGIRIRIEHSNPMVR